MEINYIYSMAPTVKIELKNKKIDISDFDRKQVEKASYRAINHALAQVKTQAIREITTTHRITASEIRGDLFVLKAGTNLTGYLKSTPWTKPLNLFNPVEIRDGVKTRFTGPRKTGGFASQKTRQKTEGITVEITRGQKVTLRGAFLKFQGDKPTVRGYGEYSGSNFAWNDDKTGKHSRLKTFSVAGAIRNEKISRNLANKAAEIYEKTYLSQLRHIAKL